MQAYGSDLESKSFDELLQALFSLDAQRALAAASTSSFSPWLAASLVPVLSSLDAKTRGEVRRPLPAYSNATQEEAYRLDFACSLASLSTAVDAAMVQLNHGTNTYCPVHGHRAAVELTTRIPVRSEQEADVLVQTGVLSYSAAWRCYATEAYASSGVVAAARACVLGQDIEALRGVVRSLRAEVAGASSVVDAVRDRFDEVEAMVNACDMLNLFQEQSILPGLLDAVNPQTTNSTEDQAKHILRSLNAAFTQYEFDALAEEAADLASSALFNGDPAVNASLADVLKFLNTLRSSNAVSSEKAQKLKHTLLQMHASDALSNGTRALSV